MSDSILKKLNKIQTSLIAPKGQFNNFGKYKYRSCEDILEALKPLLKETDVTLRITDDLIQVGERYYVKATAEISDGECSVSVNAFAREADTQKGFDASQITGSASSYARKYALNGLFCIDDTKDSDVTNTHEGEYVTEKQLMNLRDLLAQINSPEEKLCSFLKVEKLESLPSTSYQKAVSAIESKRGAK